MNNDSKNENFDTTIQDNLKTEEPKSKGEGMAKRIITAALLSFCFSFTLFVFAPLEAYIANVNDFWFSIACVLPAVVLAFALFFVLSFLLCAFLPEVLRDIVVTLIFAGTVGLYIQGNFLVKGYPAMTGEPIDWALMTGRGVINTVFWVALFALSLLFLFLKKPAFKTVIRSVSLIIVGVQIITLGSMLLTTRLKNSGTYYLSDEGLFDLSEQENIIVIVSDTFEATYLKKALERNPDIKEDLRDFTFFEDTSGISTITYLSMATIMTGEIFPLNANSYEGYRAC